jgi:hypothetical protein
MTETEIPPDPFLEAIAPALEKYRDTEERRWSLAFMKALRLAGPDLEVMEALCRGEKVPRSRLDPHWLKSYGL